MKIIKAQVSVFVILSIIIVATILLFFIFNSKINDKRNDIIAQEIQPIYDYVANCIFETGEDAIEFVGLRGGYYELPETSNELEIPYYIYNENEFTPSKEEIEKQISLYIENNLNYCTGNFDNFPDFKINFNESKVKTLIEDEKVNFKIKYPLSISKENKNYVIENFDVSVDVRLGIVYNTIIKINEYKNEICVSCIYNYAVEEDLYVDMIEYDDSLIFVVRDENLKINGKYFLFVFVNKYV